MANNEEKNNIKISAKDIQELGISLAVATPMYGGMCHGAFAKSTMDLNNLAMKLQMKFGTIQLYNESLVQRARNYCSALFLKGDHEYLLFIDADIGYNANDVIYMLYLMAQNKEYDVLAGVYSKKSINWANVQKACLSGLSNQDPNKLKEFTGDFVMNVTNDQREVKSLAEPIPVVEIGTGFMLIKRSVFIDFMAHYPEYEYRPDHLNDPNFGPDKTIWSFFHTEIDPTSKRYLSEDYWFCRKIIAMGKKVWACPWVTTSHYGTYPFHGSLATVSQALYKKDQ